MPAITILTFTWILLFLILVSLHSLAVNMMIITSHPGSPLVVVFLFELQGPAGSTVASTQQGDRGSGFVVGLGLGQVCGCQQWIPRKGFSQESLTNTPGVNGAK